MRTTVIKKLEEQLKQERPTQAILIRGIDLELLNYLRKKKVGTNLKWNELFEEMALKWLKTK